MNYKFLGKRIREERNRLNLTQEQLAEDINISTAYIGQIERGERSLTLDKLIKIANRLGVTVDYLLYDYIDSENVGYRDLWERLTTGRTTEEVEMAVNVVKLMYSYIDNLPSEVRRLKTEK